VWPNGHVTNQQLPLTGERTVPDIEIEQYWFMRHLAVYEWLLDQVQQHQWSFTVAVDAGCGEGYGAELLRRGGAHVVAIDYDETSIEHVQRKYPDLEAVLANLVDLPLPDGSVDLVVSLQVIEHLWDLPGFLGECYRVLRPGGVLVVSTPNRPVFSPGLGRGEKPVNPFHVEEFDAEQVADLLVSAGFRQPEVMGLQHAGAVASWEGEHGSIVAAHVRATLSEQWPQALADLLPTITTSDFAVADTAGGQDLIAVGYR
jgi:SAM-dependent methyltransferase